MASENNLFDIVVVGAGHAGIEAALAAARLGRRVLIVTSNGSRIGYMSCNPSIGGLAKGHMVREIDALGGEMGLAADATCIQFKRLNARKGPAVRGSRAQCDKEAYSEYMTAVLHRTQGLTVRAGEVKELILDGHRVIGVRVDDGSEVRCGAVVVTTGTFMRGVIHIGDRSFSGGRHGDKATVGLSDQLRAHGFEVTRLKTGTPARLNAQSIDFSKTQEARGDVDFYPFSDRSPRELALPQVSCWLSYTNELTHEIIRKNLHQSAVYSGQIEGTGPRYCPSIEDKVTRFAERTQHQTFLEPESLRNSLIYLQGISTSLPEVVQDQFLRTIPGLEQVEVVRYGYAVEYDFVEPTQIRHSLETRCLKGLFLAGQINGTSGYEEAAAQGFIAGVNAVRSLTEDEPFVLRRDEAYIGVLIDDLVSKGTKEPYRMFTSRAEHRLVLREDNTLERLWNRATEIGIIPVDRRSDLERLIEQRSQLTVLLNETVLTPKQEVNQRLLAIGTTVLTKPVRASDLLRRPEVGFADLSAAGFVQGSDPRVYEPVEIELKYSGYIEIEKSRIENLNQIEAVSIPSELDFNKIRGLSAEEIEKLTEKKPRTLGQASRLSGVNPSAVQAIAVHLLDRNVMRSSKERVLER